ncbi:MAG TPA: thiamine pyrophosphate-dependent enzyme [Gemmatimonadaceae bacterium]|nr:thiamine pyrophosphate-dependent enzyme [Gemmatimonadaceae bacterium]
MWYARDVQVRRGMMASRSGTLATMGGAVPYAIGAKFAHPHRPVVAVLGDGAMEMLGTTSLITIAKYWRRWRDPRFVVLVLSNRELNHVTWDQRVMEGFQKCQASQDLIDVSFARSAELLGLHGIGVDQGRADAPRGSGGAGGRRASCAEGTDEHPRRYSRRAPALSDRD